MSDYADSEDFGGIEEPEGEDHQDVSDGGVVETWEPLKIEFLRSSIQDLRNQQSSQEPYIKRIKAGRLIEQEEMRQWLVRWLTTWFAILTVIGLIALVTTRDSRLLVTILSGTGLFVILLAVIFHHYFRHPKK